MGRPTLAVSNETKNSSSNQWGGGYLVRYIITLPFAGVLLINALTAQEVPRLSWNIGGGFSSPIGTTGRNLDRGWNVGGGLGFNFNSHFGVIGEAKHNMLGINSSTLSSLGFPGGDITMTSFTLNPIVHLMPRGPVDLYLIGGGGIYRRNQEFTAPGSQSVVGFNPFFGFYSFNVPVTQVLTSYSVIKPGVNGGAGIAFGTAHGKIFAESRYHRMLMRNSHTDVIDFTVGFRR